jgi:Fe-S cluster assembly scaffold protein SufB
MLYAKQLIDVHLLTALHTALLNGGVFVYVPKNVVVEDPIQYVVLHDNENASLFNHAIIVDYLHHLQLKGNSQHMLLQHFLPLQ